MKKLFGRRKFRILKTAVFISGTGSNLRNLIKFSLTKRSPIKIIQVVSSYSKAKGLEFAKKYKIKHNVYNFKNRMKSENEILINLKKDKIDLICLVGFMKILSKNLLRILLEKYLTFTLLT